MIDDMLSRTAAPSRLAVRIAKRLVRWFPSDFETLVDMIEEELSRTTTRTIEYGPDDGRFLEMIPKGCIKRVHVNNHVVAANRRNGEDEPPLRVKARGKNLRARRIMFDGPVEMVYKPDQPLPCGARVWIETRAAVTVFE